MTAVATDRYPLLKALLRNRKDGRHAADTVACTYHRTKNALLLATVLKTRGVTPADAVGYSLEQRADVARAATVRDPRHVSDPSWAGAIAILEAMRP